MGAENDWAFVVCTAAISVNKSRKHDTGELMRELVLATGARAKGDGEADIGIPPEVLWAISIRYSGLRVVTTCSFRPE